MRQVHIRRANIIRTAWTVRSAGLLGLFAQTAGTAKTARLTRLTRLTRMTRMIEYNDKSENITDSLLTHPQG